MQTAKMKEGKPEVIEIDRRHAQFVAQFAIGDVFDALVELITNCDDSYHRLYLKGVISQDGGPITIRIDRRSKDTSLIQVRDRAEGMTLEEMREKIKRIGFRTAGEPSRGFMGRGAKDCATLGRVIFESIKDDIYHKSEINSQFEFIPYNPSIRATNEIRKELGILRGNGTVVTLEVAPEHSFPQFGTLCRDLPYHFALKDILAERNPTKVTLVDMKGRQNKQNLLYQQPEGELKVNEEFDVSDYPGIKAKLQIWRSPEQLDNGGKRFRRNGIVIKGERAIHECSLLSDEFEKDPLASRYLGRLECGYIDKLCRDYDDWRARGNNHPKNNPVLIIDPNRQTGIRKDHPFTKALLKKACEYIRIILAEDRKKEMKEHTEIANKETKERLNRLARAAGKFLKQQIDELEEVAPGEVDKEGFDKEGIFIYPTYLKVPVGEERKLAVYVKEAIIGDKKSVIVSCDDNAIYIVDRLIELKPHKQRPNLFIGYFRIKWINLKDAVLIDASLNQRKSGTAIIQIVDKVIEERIFADPLEFECKKYKIGQGRKRKLRLYAKFPEVVYQETQVDLSSSDTLAVPVRGRCTLIPIAGSNYAYGEILTEGRRLNATAVITAKVNEYEAITVVRVISKSSEDKTIPIRIELREEDFHNFRASWADYEGKPNLLLISAKHKSISRYFGAAPQFEGQNTPHFRVILAEIVAESICRKSLELESQERSWDFSFADEKEGRLIVNSVLAELQKRMREFLPIAHSIMLNERELQAISKSPLNEDYHLNRSEESSINNYIDTSLRLS